MATSADFSKSVTAASDEVKDIYCEPCADGGKQTEAEGFCVDCSEYLCGQCYKNHKRYKAFKHHVLQDKHTMPADITKAGVKDVCLEKCAVHSPKVIEYFCRTCDQLGCTACITVNHRRCEHVDHIPNIAKDLERSEEFKEFKSALDEHLEAVNERKKTITSNQTETDVMKTKAKAELTKQQEVIKKFFHNLELEMERQIEDIDKNNKKTLKTVETTCDSINDELKQMKTDTDTKLKNEQKCELFIAMKKYQPKMEHVGTECEKLVRESTIQRYALTPSSQVKKVMKNTSEICRLSFAKFVSEINVGTDNDKGKPSVYDCAIVQNHFLALTDSKNRSVKLYDTKKMSLANEKEINCSEVKNIASVQDNQIVVAVRNGMWHTFCIISVSTSGSLSIDYNIETNCQCYGLAYSREKLIKLNFKKIVVTDMHGNLLELIKTQLSEHIAVSPDHETIYITDASSSSVTSMTLQGKIKTTYQDTDLKSPQGITVDNDGLVYVCSPGTSTIHQLTEDLRKVQILIENEPGTTVTYSNTENRLYLGWSNMIKVYQLE